MSTVLVSVAGLAGLVLSVWLTARAWHTERPAALVLSPEETRIRRVALVVQRASGVCAAGLVTGILVLGLGGRLMMRVLAATSPDSAQGRFTDAEFRVGEVTLAGTVSFVLFMGLFGGMLTVGAWVLLRRWLPNRSWMAGLILTGIGAGLLARPVGLIDPDNRDFLILSPVWLAVLIAGLILLLHGVTFAVLADRWANRWPTIERTWRGVLAAAPAVVVFGFGAALLIPAAIMAAEICYVAWRRPRSARTQRWLSRTDLPGRWILAVAATLGTIWVGISAIQVLTL